MRKTTLAMTCLVALALLASCKKDVQPSIHVATGTIYAGQNTELFSSDPITVGFSATGENLTLIEMSASQNGTILYTNAQNIDAADSYLYTHTFAVDAVGTVTISGTVTDAKGHTAMTSFDIICYEKPNAKFVGHYEGDALITGTLNIISNNMDPMHQEMQDEPMSVRLNIVSGENNNEVIAYAIINEQENPDPVIGTVNGNKVSFEAIDVPFTMNYEFNSMNIPFTLNMTYNIIGTLNDGMLDLEGECKGNGDFNMMFIISGTIDMEGTIGGSLNKTE